MNQREFKLEEIPDYRLLTRTRFLAKDIGRLAVKHGLMEEPTFLPQPLREQYLAYYLMRYPDVIRNVSDDFMRDLAQELNERYQTSDSMRTGIHYVKLFVDNFKGVTRYEAEQYMNRLKENL